MPNRLQIRNRLQTQERLQIRDRLQIQDQLGAGSLRANQRIDTNRADSGYRHGRRSAGHRDRPRHSSGGFDLDRQEEGVGEVCESGGEEEAGGEPQQVVDGKIVHGDSQDRGEIHDGIEEAGPYDSKDRVRKIAWQTVYKSYAEDTGEDGREGDAGFGQGAHEGA